MGDFEGIQVLLSSWLIRALQKLDPQICMYIYIYAITGIYEIRTTKC